MADPAKKGNVALEEDDEFEDFPQDEWEPSVEDLKKKELWDKSWDDDSLDDPVGQQLRAVLPTVAQGGQAQQQAQQ